MIADEILSQLEKDYYKRIVPAVRKEILELKAEIGDLGKEQRHFYLLKQLILIENEIAVIYAQYKRLTEADSPYLEKYISTLRLAGLERQLKKIKYELKVVKSSNGNSKITPEQVIQARDFPISELIEVIRNKALCPFHDDHNPSMGIKNNRYHCFACGEKGDVIEFVMKRECLNFVEAVKRLQ